MARPRGHLPPTEDGGAALEEGAAITPSCAGSIPPSGNSLPRLKSDHDDFLPMYNR